MLPCGGGGGGWDFHCADHVVDVVLGVVGGVVISVVARTSDVEWSNAVVGVVIGRSFSVELMAKAPFSRIPHQRDPPLSFPLVDRPIT